MNDKSSIFMGFQDGKIMHFDQKKNEFQRELRVKDSKIVMLSHLRS